VEFLLNVLEQKSKSIYCYSSLKAELGNYLKSFIQQIS